MSDFFCPLPWIHQFIQPDGVKMCCSSNTLLNVTPAEFNSSAYLTNVKSTINQGNIPSDCRGCVQLEAQGYTSTRTLALNDWDYTINTVPNQTLYLDIRWSNLCNFSCRSCGPSFSSEIAREQQLLPVHRFNNQAINDVFESLGTVKRINFTGGEPLLIKENIRVLEQLISLGQTNCEILITTNASVINGHIVDLIKQFNNVHWTISLDAVGIVAEYIRNGTDWDRVNTNIETILGLKQSVSFNCVLSAYSILAIDDLVDYYANLKLQYNQQPIELWFAVCEYPASLHPQSLTTSLKNRAEVALDRAISTLSTDKTNPIRSIDSLKALKNNLNDSTIYKQAEFIEITRNLDELRNQNFSKVFNLEERAPWIKKN